MALDQKTLQKKRAKRQQKRQQTKSKVSGLSASLSLARDWARVGQAPIADVLVPTRIFEQGIGTVWLSRQLSDGRYAVAGMLVDVFCLGVKNALYTMIEAADYPQFLARIQMEPMERQHPSCARKLVEGALAYAKDLGFDPHADYRIARSIFGDIDPAACPVGFTFGRDGKPFYFDGPQATPALSRRILKQLERRCGPDGYDYMVSASDPDEFL